MCMMNWLKKLTLLKLLILVIQSKHNYDTKPSQNEKKLSDHDHNDNYITKQELNKLTTENFAAVLKPVNLATFSN